MHAVTPAASAISFSSFASSSQPHQNELDLRALVLAATQVTGRRHSDDEDEDEDEDEDDYSHYDAAHEQSLCASSLLTSFITKDPRCTSRKCQELHTLLSVQDGAAAAASSVNTCRAQRLLGLVEVRLSDPTLDDGEGFEAPAPAGLFTAGSAIFVFFRLRLYLERILAFQALSSFMTPPAGAGRERAADTLFRSARRLRELSLRVVILALQTFAMQMLKSTSDSNKTAKNVSRAILKWVTQSESRAQSCQRLILRHMREAAMLDAVGSNEIGSREPPKPLSERIKGFKTKLNSAVTNLSRVQSVSLNLKSSVQNTKQEARRRGMMIAHISQTWHTYRLLRKVMSRLKSFKDQCRQYFSFVAEKRTDTLRRLLDRWKQVHSGHMRDTHLGDAKDLENKLDTVSTLACQFACRLLLTNLRTIILQRPFWILGSPRPQPREDLRAVEGLVDAVEKLELERREADTEMAKLKGELEMYRQAISTK